MRLTSYTLLPLFLTVSAAVVTHARSYDFPYDARDSLSSRAAEYYRQDARRFAPYQARELVDELLASRDLDSYKLYGRMLSEVPSELLVRALEGRLGETFEKRGKNQSKQGKYNGLSGTDPAEDTDPAAGTSTGQAAVKDFKPRYGCGFQGCTKWVKNQEECDACTNSHTAEVVKGMALF